MTPPALSVIVLTGLEIREACRIDREGEVQKYYQLLKDCFWEYDFTADDIDKIIVSGDVSEKKFLFGKILANSTWLLKDLKLFPKDELKSLLHDYTVPEFNSEYLSRRKNIAEFYFFDQELKIEELKWVG